MTYDLTIIGSGPGGYVAAIRAAQLGLKTALIEEREVGGTCLNRGCIPTKSLLHSAEVYHTVAHCESFGVVADNINVDYARIASRKNAVVKQLRSGVEHLLKSHGVHLLRGRGVLEDRNMVAVTGPDAGRIRSSNILLATGSRPAVPPISGSDSPQALTSDQVLELDSCPASVVIIGGGVIGMEFATIFHNLGTPVTVIEMLDTILPGVEHDIAAAFRTIMEGRGVKIVTGARVTNIAAGSPAVCEFEQGGTPSSATGEIVLVAIGRQPNTGHLGLDNIGVLPEKGFIPVNDRLETSVKGVYAIGDVTGRAMLAHVASAQGLAAVGNIAGDSQSVDYGRMPGCVYTNPEIAAVGLTEDEALHAGKELKIGTFPVRANSKSLIMGERDGFVKIISDADTGEILGAHMLAPRATDMIAEFCAAMRLESTIEELAHTVHPHPTVSEMMMEAAHDVNHLCVHAPRR